ncbi:protein OPI10 homolog [Culicoides brevitarsis]|uniref:protein OPI10 homolog n=1 Tax=Culicoides brevitarsis TaxID=469753 RepID=UPI00307B19EC
MLGLIVSGRLVQTNFQEIEPGKYLIEIPEADNINHIVVFLTADTPMALGTAGAVYFSWPDPNSPPQFQYLGHISNSKPSAIFKINQLKKLHELEVMDQGSVFGQQQISHTAQIGVSIEPEVNVLQQTSAIANTGNSYLQFGQKILENFFNFASSFAVTQSQMQPNPMETFVPLSTLQSWYVNFQRRLEQNPNFWKN